MFPIDFGGYEKSLLAAVDKSHAVIEFDLTGTILNANKNFCDALGYQRADIIGKKHRLFVDPAEAESNAYRDFWQRLGEGRYEQGQFKRYGKGGREVWIEATYNPIFKRGKPYRIVKLATDITAKKLASIENEGKLEALDRAQAIIEFTPKGEIITANGNFLKTFGYELSEIRGKHHSMFCEADYVRNPQYTAFWRDLAAGHFKSDQFTRIAKNGEKVFIQASYNPVMGADGRVIKVVKFASDVSGRVKALEAVGAGLNRLSDCNIRITIDEPFIPEFDHLRTDFNTSIAKFQETLVEVLKQTNDLAGESQQMSSASEGLARRTEQQAAALEQTSAALEEITVTVRQSSERTHETRRLVGDARKAASASVDVVGNAIQAINRIQSASQEIGKIIDVIDQIAFQTNLLALNAGVEAARAGDAGKGFAVVAQEVRDLAQRSANAAKEIAGLINNSSKEVGEGVRFVGETGEALKKIEELVEAIDRNVDAINTAAREQSTSLGEINSAVNQLDQMTQQNSGLVGNTAHISERLASGAARLAELVNRFKLNRRGTIREPGSDAANHKPRRQNAA
ncbi:PAS domain-containing methyl-accepting chemotaxis protein [Rhizobium sp. NRK18]|uniref:methyl-accepting chemotaxis protein n=1 Tax=Rhizobium sp. NRK18 TaxID=2964667 RepID=UPI0021C274A0|nr:PAS domain-containing methyl-accepting chemotaxis protein [Rhizobium sp. NRK18]MCQ2004329.1 PAS domain-containing methyl-accepting chemotaxis protein [Rhizobium sp. NRK18]